MKAPCEGEAGMATAKARTRKKKAAGAQPDEELVTGMGDGIPERTASENVETTEATAMWTEESGEGVKTGQTTEAAEAAAKEESVGALKGLGEIEMGLVGFVRDTLNDTVKATSDVATQTVSVAKGVVSGALTAVEAVSTTLVGSASNVARGVITGVNEVGGDLLTTAQKAVSGTVKGAAELGTDVAAVARNAVDGVVNAVRDIGVNVESAVKETVGGAIDTVGFLGVKTVSTARDILVGTVVGVKDVLAAIPPRSDAGFKGEQPPA